jgi:hypothetical protein
MSTEVQAANAGADQKPVVKNMSRSEFFAARYQARMGEPKAQKSPEAIPEQPKEEVAPEPEGPKAEVAQEEPAPKPEETQSSEDQKVLSKDYDLESMSEEELRELSQKLGSKAVARFGELTAKRKAAEEQLEALKAEIAKREESSFEAKVKDNPYANIATKEDLDAKYQELSEVMEWAEEKLDRAEDLAADDVVTTDGGREYTKRELREIAKRARKARDVYIPAQGKEIQLAKNRADMKQLLGEKAKTELPWLSGEDNDVRKQYEVMMNDPKFKSVERALPDLASQLPYLLAHAANSIYARKTVETKPASRLSPPSPVVSQSSDSNKPEARQSKAVADLSSRFAQSGSYRDFKTLRALKYS